MSDHGFMRLYRLDGDSAGDGAPILFVAATAGLKGDRLDLGSGIPWDFSRGIAGDQGPRYPFLWVHDLAGRNLPLGVADVLTAVDELPMRVAVTFGPEDELATRVRGKYLSPVGGLAGISVSWDDVGDDGVPVRATGKKVAARQLLEISAVPVGLDPEALKEGARTELVQHLRAVEAALGFLQAAAATHAGERPYPNEHACRLRDPGEFDEKSFRREERESDGKPYSVILGRLKGEKTMTEQAYRYPTDDWSADEAQAHCEAHDGIDFEAAAAAEERAMQAKTDEVPIESTVPDRNESDEDLWRTCAAAMVDVFDRGSDDSDEKRRRGYNALLPTYRRLAKEPPELVGGDELRALDDGNWRGLFLAGELEVVSDGARAGKVLSTRNEADITAGLDAITEGEKSIKSVLDRAAGREPFPPKKDDDSRRRVSECSCSSPSGSTSDWPRARRHNNDGQDRQCRPGHPGEGRGAHGVALRPAASAGEAAHRGHRRRARRDGGHRAQVPAGGGAGQGDRGHPVRATGPLRDRRPARARDPRRREADRALAEWSVRGALQGRRGDPGPRRRGRRRLHARHGYDRHERGDRHAVYDRALAHGDGRSDRGATHPLLPDAGQDGLHPGVRGPPVPVAYDESTQDDSADYDTQDTTFAGIAVTAAKFGLHQKWSGEIEEESIVPFVQAIRERQQASLAFYTDDMLVNGDTTIAASGNVNSDDAQLASNDRRVKFDGIRKAAIVDNGANCAAIAGASLAYSDITALRNLCIDRTRLVAWAHPGSPRDFVFLVNPEGYDTVQNLTELITVDKYGQNATVLTGEVGAIGRNPLLVTMSVPMTEADGKVSATPGNNTRDQIVAFNRNALSIGYLRQLTVETYRRPYRDQNGIILFWRMALARYTPTGAASGIEWAAVLRNW